MGPGQTTNSLANATLAEHRDLQIFASTQPLQGRSDADVAALLTTLGQLWLNGVEIDWAAFSAHEERRRVALPSYPFARTRYWIEAQNPAESGPPSAVEESTIVQKNAHIEEWFYTPNWIPDVVPPCGRRANDMADFY